MWTGERKLEQASSSLGEYGFALRRYAVPFGFYLALWLGLGGLYCWSVKPDFFASVELVLQPQFIIPDRPLADQQVSQTTLNVEEAENELQLIRSRRLLRGVFDALKLNAVPELVDGYDGVWAAVSRILHRFAFDPMVRNPVSQAFERFVGRVRARRLGSSFVIEIAYRSRDPQVAARVANAVTSAYLSDRVGRTYADIEVDAPYLKDRMASILMQDRVAHDAVDSGMLPDHYLEDAGVRPLGPSVVPLAKLFPKAGLVLLLCGGIGLISGLFLITILVTLDRPLRTRRQLYRRLGLACLGPLEANRRRGLSALSSNRRWSETWKSVRAAVTTAEPAGDAPVVGFAACRQGAEGRAMAQDFVDAFAPDAERPVIADWHSAETIASTEADQAAEAVYRLIKGRRKDKALAVALPPLGGGANGPAILPLLDAVILVVVADRTTCGDVMAALHALRRARVAFGGIVFDDGGRRSGRDA